MVIVVVPEVGARRLREENALLRAECERLGRLAAERDQLAESADEWRRIAVELFRERGR